MFYVRIIRSGVVVLGIGLALSGCMSAEETRRANFNDDVDTCGAYGARRGSDAYTECMLRQQERRDDAVLRNAEAARINSETARNNVALLKRLREDRE